MSNEGRRRGTFGALLCVALLAGCANPVQRNYFPKVTGASAPLLNTVVNAQLGDSMLMQAQYTETEAIRVVRPIAANVLGATYTLSAGYYVKFAQDEKGDYFVPESGTEGGVITHSWSLTPGQSLFVPRDASKVCAVNLHSEKFCTADFDIERTTRRITSANAFQQTLIYSGRIGDRINIGYRESSSDQARPAFNNEVEYDLGESRIIGYKGAEVEVIDANNRSITYKVIRNFNKAER